MKLDIDESNDKDRYAVISEVAAIYNRKDFDMFIGGVQYGTWWDINTEMWSYLFCVRRHYLILRTTINAKLLLVDALNFVQPRNLQELKELVQW